MGNTGWAVFTGASSGLGREFSLALARRGHPVPGVARRCDRLQALADEVGASGGSLEPFVADLSTPAGLEGLLTRVAELEVDLLVNNAGLVTYGRFVSLPAPAVAPGFVNTEFADVAGSHHAERRFPHLNARHVAETALRAHDRGRTVKSVGALYAFLAFSTRFAPRSLLRRMLARVMRPSA
jgi:short-subunit dehydrogenase